MQSSDVQNTIKSLSRTGVGIDGIGHSMHLFHQLNCKIVAHKIAESGSNSGIYYIEGDVTNFLSGYTYFHIDGREFDDNNIFQVDSSTYDENAQWTQVVITENANYKANANDVGFNICGRYDLVSNKILQSIGDVNYELYEEGSLGNLSSGEFSFKITDSARTFYDKVNRTGYFYQKDIFTEVTSISSETKYSAKSGVCTTWINVKDLDIYDGSDFQFGFVEFLTGRAAGIKFPIIQSNGYYLKVIGHISKSYEQLNEFHIPIEVGDKLRVFKANTFYVLFQVWARNALDEKLPNFSGKVDLSTVETDDLERTVEVKAYDGIKNTFEKTLSDIDWDFGLGLPRLTEIKAFYQDAYLRRMRRVLREEVEENPLSSVRVIEVAHDVTQGWHSIDYHPTHLFRFDLGKWYYVHDEGSFEKSTQSVFLASNEDGSNYDYYAELPPHNVDDLQNDLIEREWHGGWARINIATEEASFVGAVGAQNNNSGNVYWKKLSGLPSIPAKLIFHVNDKREIDYQTVFSYRYDDGSPIVPAYLFDLIIEMESENGVSIRDLTYPLGMGSKLDVNFTGYYDYPMKYNLGDTPEEKQLRCYSSRKFHGIEIVFRNFEYWYYSYPDYYIEASSFGNLLTTYVQHMSLHFTNGNSWQENINLIYAGGYKSDAASSTTTLTLNTVQSISRDGGADGEYGDYQTAMVGMRLLCVSSTNFGVSKEILTVSDGGGDGEDLDITTEAFPNNLTQYDRFLVVNKNFDIKFMGNGDAFKDGEHPDVLALNKFKSSGSTGTIFQDLKKHSGAAVNTLPALSVAFSPEDKLYIGHKNKFNGVAFSLSVINNSEYEDYADIAWYIKQNKYIVEYWNGLEWVTANEVSIVPTTLVGLDDDDTDKFSYDDLVKYRIYFKADDWHTGGYDYTTWLDNETSSQAPSNIDEDNIYCIRVIPTNNYPMWLSYVSLAEVSDVNIAVTWKDIPGWAKNSVELSDGKYFVDTLQDADVNLDLYGIELQCRKSLLYMRQVRPLSKLEGSLEDNLYAAFDYTQINPQITEDLITVNDKGFSTIPQNINYIHLLKKIFENIGYIKNQKFFLHNDDYTIFDKNFLNIIGTGYDGVKPIDIGWDRAFVPELLLDFTDETTWGQTYRHISVLRIPELSKYFLYGIRSTIGPNIDLWVSDDAKNWTLDSTDSDNVSDDILAYTTVKNRDNQYYTHYRTVWDSGNSRYIVEVGVATDDYTEYASPTTPGWTSILTTASKNYGSCSVLHIKGNPNATSNCYRLMAVVQYSTAAVDGNGVPTGIPSILFYKSDSVDCTSWSYLFTLPVNGTDPVFVEASVCENDVNVSSSEMLNNIALIFKGTDNKLYRVYPSAGDLESQWKVPVAINDTTTTYSGFSAINDSYRYNYVKDEDRDAFTLVPYEKELNVLIGVNGSNAPKALAINKTVTDWNTDLFWLDKTQEMNEVDWFKSDTERITISDGVSANGKHKRIYLGLRVPFNKILSRSISIPYLNRLKARYWNGIEWSDFDRIYQNGKLITDSKVNPIFGFYFDNPTDWVSSNFDNIISDFTYDGLSQPSNSLYWIELSLPSDATSSSIIVKGFRNCFTNIFAWKGNSLFMMQNWEYMKHLYTFSAELDKGINIDSISYDKADKLILVNTISETKYDYRISETYPFDVFGKIKASYPLWNENLYDSEYHRVSSEKPASLVRIGKPNEATISGTDYDFRLIGIWDESFLEDIYYGSSAVNVASAGLNIPIPKEQDVKLWWRRNTDSELDIDGEWTYKNNIWIARRLGLRNVETYSPDSGGQYRYTNSYSYLVASLTRSGLLYEELINSPFRRLPVGYYAFCEKNRLDRNELFPRLIIVYGFITTEPVTPSDGYVYVISNVVDNSSLDAVLRGKKGWLMRWNASLSEWSYNVPAEGTIISDASDSNTLYEFKKGYWEAPDSDNIWPGLDIVETALDKLWLNWTVGQEGVLLDYFRDYNLRPLRFRSNNTEQYFDKKRILSFRDLFDDLLLNNSIGGVNYDGFQENLKATCAVLLPDATAMKDSPGDVSITENDGYDASATVRVMEPNTPAVAFGMYAFKDIDEYSGSTVRDNTSEVNPYAYSGIGLMKYGGKIRNWKKAFYYNGASHSDVTNDMNYKIYGGSYGLDFFGSGEYMYLCSDSKCFAFTIAFEEIFSSGSILIEYYDGSNWQTIDYSNADFSRVINPANDRDNWNYKTRGMHVTFDPFYDSWQRANYQGTTGYWIRVSANLISGSAIAKWIVLSGTMLWDNMWWWNDYTINSNKYPGGSPTDDEKEYFDTFIPVSIEYDIHNKKLLGCFWDCNPSSNKYYPFKISFDREELWNEAGEYFWSWDNQEEITIVDKDEFDYSMNMKSLSCISRINTKVVVADDSNPDKIPFIANLKNLESGESLFPFYIE